MIQIKKRGNGYQIAFEAHPPSIYLDTCAVCEFASKKHLRDDFFASFERHGTLFFSWPGIIELAASPERLTDQVRSFFYRIGDKWWPLDANPVRVKNAEQRGVGMPIFGEQFLKPHLRLLFKERRTLRLDGILDYFKRNEEARQAVVDTTAKTKEEGCCDLREWRDRWIADEQGRWAKFRRLTKYDEAAPTRAVFYGLIELVCKERFNITPNDTLDFYHAAVAIAYANIVVLDKKWASLGVKLGEPARHVAIFDSTDAGLVECVKCMKHLADELDRRGRRSARLGR